MLVLHRVLVAGPGSDRLAVLHAGNGRRRGLSPGESKSLRGRNCGRTESTRPEGRRGILIDVGGRRVNRSRRRGEAPLFHGELIFVCPRYAEGLRRPVGLRQLQVVGRARSGGVPARLGPPAHHGFGRAAAVAHDVEVLALHVGPAALFDDGLSPGEVLIGRRTHGDLVLNAAFDVERELLIVNGIIRDLIGDALLGAIRPQPLYGFPLDFEIRTVLIGDTVLVLDGGVCRHLGRKGQRILIHIAFTAHDVAWAIGRSARRIDIPGLRLVLHLIGRPGRGRLRLVVAPADLVPGRDIEVHAPLPGLLAILALDDQILQSSGVDIHIPQKVVCLAGAGHRDLPSVLAQAGGVALQNQLFVHDGSGHAERRPLRLEGRIDALSQGLQRVFGMDLDAQPPAADADPEVGLRGPAQGAREGPGDLVRKGIGTLDLALGQLQDLEVVDVDLRVRVDGGRQHTLVGAALVDPIYLNSLRLVGRGKLERRQRAVQLLQRDLELLEILLLPAERIPLLHHHERGLFRLVQDLRYHLVPVDPGRDTRYGHVRHTKPSCSSARTKCIGLRRCVFIISQIEYRRRTAQT